MKKILKKAELINTLADSVATIMLVEENENYIIEAYAFSSTGDLLLCEYKNIYTTYRSAIEKYNKLIVDFS